MNRGSRSGAYSRRKGFDFERSVAQALRPIFPGARRGLQYQDGIHAADIENTLYFIECKSAKKVNIESAFRQIELTRKESDKRPSLVIYKVDRCVPTVAIRLSDFVKLLKEGFLSGHPPTEE